VNLTQVYAGFIDESILGNSGHLFCNYKLSLSAGLNSVHKKPDSSHHKTPMPR